MRVNSTVPNNVNNKDPDLTSDRCAVKILLFRLLEI